MDPLQRNAAGQGRSSRDSAPLNRVARPNPFETIGYGVMTVFLFLMFGRPADFWLSWLHLPLILSIVSLMAAILSGQLIKVLQMRAAQLMLVLTAWLLICVPFSFHRFGSLAMIGDKWFKTLFCFLIILSLVVTVRQAMRLQTVIACSMLMASFLALAYGVSPYGRIMLPRGLLSGPNDVATVMLFGLLLWLSKLLNPFSSIWMRVVALAAMCPLGFVLLKTASRGAMVTLMVVSVIMMFRLPAKQKLGMAMAVVALLVSALVVLPPELRNRYMVIFSTAEQDEFVDKNDEFQQGDAISSTGGRLYLLQRSLELSLKHPLFGVGPDQFPNADDQAVRAEGGRKGTWHGTHNTYTQFSSETGVPGLLIFLAILACGFKELKFVERNAKRFNTPFAAEIRFSAMSARTILIAQCIFLVFEHSSYMPFWPALLSLGLVLSKTFRNELPRMEAEAAAAAAVNSTSKPARKGWPGVVAGQPLAARS